MKTLFTVFIDGLKPENLSAMPYIGSLSYQNRIRTDMGYSVTCHASMYSGVYPNKHHVWFSTYNDPIKSPYNWLNKSGLDKIPDNDWLKFLCYKMTTKFGPPNNSFHGIPYFCPKHIIYFYGIP